MAAKDGTKALEDLLVKIEIDSDDWVKKSAREKLKMLVSEVRMNSEKLVGVAEDLVSSIASIVRANTSNPAVDAYLGLVETGFGLLKANTVMNNVFVSAKHEVHNQYDALAKFMRVGRGIDMVGDSMESTCSICKAFISLTPKEQAKYGIRFRKVSEEVPEDDDKNAPLVTMIDTDYTYKGETFRIGFEVSYYEAKRKGDRLGDESSYAFINFATPIDQFGFDAMESVPAMIYGCYIDRVDIKKNIIKIKNGILYVEPRVNIDFDVKNFDLYDEEGRVIRTMETESALIRRILNAGGRRGYIVQGDQGTGKTISVNKMLMSFTDVPVFWISPDSISKAAGMDNVFRVLNMFPGSFFVFDDFDGNNFSTKNALTGAFIDYIDETNSPQYRGITILIINEPQKLHSTIKLRPGRIDDIIYVMNPGNVEQVCDVVEQTFRHLGHEKPEWVSPENPEFASACEPVFGAHLTHAYIAGVVTDMVKYCPEDISVGKFRELVSRRITTIKYARMVAMDDGHIVDGGPPKEIVPETINSESDEDDLDDIFDDGDLPM